jgi:hypothetical protein
MSKLSRFAGLMGSFGAKKAEDKPEDKPEAGKKGEKPEQRDDESDEDYKKRLDEWEKEQDDEEAARRAEEDENCKKAKEEGKEEGRKAENVRWSTVLASAEAQGKAAIACDFLADSPEMSADAIIKVLGKIGAQSTRSTVSARHPAPTPAPATGDGHDDPTKAKGPKGFAARVAAAAEKARGVTKKAS